LHNAVGIYSAAIVLVLGCTGIVVRFDEQIGQWLHARAGTANTKRNVPSVEQPGATTVDADVAVRSALAALPGTRALFLSLPANAKDSYLVVVRYPEDLTPGGRSWVNVDQYSGKALNFQSSRTVAWGSRAIILNRAIHTGDFFGYPSKILMAVTCLLLVSQSVTGYYMWWRKLRARMEQSKPEKTSA
jgi:uncharacterized iron-regulated membrane protein